jgi:hypothetical protein
VAGAAVVALLVTGGAAAVGVGHTSKEVPAGIEPVSTGERAAPSTTSTSTAPAIAPPTTSAPARPSAAPASLSAYDSCGALSEHVRDAALEHVTAHGLGGGPTMAVADSGATATAGSASGAGSAASPQFSTTNNQEAGVDEPDIVKNDGERAFTVSGSVLRAVRVTPDAVEVADALDLGMVGAELLEVGDRLVAMAATGPFATRVVVVRSDDPSALEIVNTIDVEGAYLSARRIGDTVRMVVTQNGPAFDFVYPQSDDPAEADRALAHNRAEVASTPLAEWLPDVTFATGPRYVPAPACDQTYLTSTFAGPGSTTVVTISPGEAAVLDATAVLATAGEVYATAEHLYVATSAWGEVGQAVTEIHRFDVSDPRRSVYESSGAVAGTLLRPPWFAGSSTLGQWSMSEHGGDLRVATTVMADDGAVTGAVAVLRQAAGRLVPVGALVGLGVNEQLYAVRFMGTRGYVVTYRRVDPLFVLDLSVPEAPRLAGELKVPGYSAYLHPIDDVTLLGIGQADDDEDGIADGTAVSVFDVSDPANPRQLSTLQLGERGTLAGAESDHRSFTWWPSPARAVLTLTNFEDTRRFQGAVVLDPTGGLHEVGRIEHREEGAECAVPVERSRVVGDGLLTFSAAGIAVHGLEDAAPRSWVRYDGPDRSCSPSSPPVGTAVARD